MEKIRDQFDTGWWLKLSEFLLSPEFVKIGATLLAEYKQGYIITPNFKDTFRAFKECKYENLKVIMLGLDPYPQPRVADGLAFSAKNHPLEPPVSFTYMIDAMEKDVYGGFGIAGNHEYDSTDLSRWANQGVLLLNQALSTHQGQSGTHLTLWYPFIKYVFNMLNKNNTGLVYILLGSKARQWRPLIDEKQNYVLEASHPASVWHTGKKEWDCNKIFSETNFILDRNQGEDAKILW